MRRAGGSLIVLFAFYAIAAGAQVLRAQESELSAAPEQTAHQKSEQVPEQKSEQVPEQRSEQVPEQKSEQVPEQKPEQGSQQASLPKPESAAENTSQPVPEGPKVDFSAYEPGTIVVETSERKLHLILPDREVLTYPVGVGKAGKSWVGTGAIAGKFIRPPWSPPRRLKLEKPWTPNYIPGGSPSNPMGAAAMTLNVDQYAIHGTNDPRSIGGFVSFGCIRMHNRDILDLYKRVKVGTRVVVLR